MKSSLESLGEALDKKDLRVATGHLRNLVLQPLNAVQWQRLNRLVRQHEVTWRRAEAMRTVHVAVLGSHTTRVIADMLPGHFLAEGLWAEVYEGDYGSIATGPLTADSELYRCKPDYVLISTGIDFIHEWPAPGAEEAEVEALAEHVVQELRVRWQAIRTHSQAQIIQHNFEPPPLRPLGNLEGRLPSSRSNFVQRLNQKLWRQDGQEVRVLDIHQAAEGQGARAWSSPRWYFHSKHGFDPAMAGAYSLALGGLLRAMLGLARKVLVCDLDNTLWGGVIGDDGMDGIQLGSTSAGGEAFAHFQQYVRDLGRQGVMLAVCSKNEIETAQEPFRRHPGCVLKMEDIAAWECSWGVKSEGLRNIARTLNVGRDALVFVDDNPAECAEVRSALPEVTVLHLEGDPAFFARQLDDLRLFAPLEITQEDLGRRQSLRSTAGLDAAKANPASLPDYLRSLEMTAEIRQAGEADLGRLEQLFKKTNQFNWNGKAWSKEELGALSASPTHHILAVWLTDRHASHGLISCVVLESMPDAALEICNWVMSCRVFSRTLEDVVLTKMLNLASEVGCNRLCGRFTRTAKNAYVENFLDRSGFKAEEDVRSLPSSHHACVPDYITLRSEQLLPSR